MKKFKDHIDDEDLNQFEEDTMGNLKEQRKETEEKKNENF